MSQSDCTSITPVYSPENSETLCAQYGNESYFQLYPTSNTVYNTSQLGSGTHGPVTFAYVCINGDLIVDNDYIFENCIIKMKPGSKIIVTTGGSLTIKNTKLFCCEKMWQGIQTQYFSSVDVNGNSTIEDAECALKLSTWSGLNISNSLLNRNFIGIGVNFPLSSNLYLGGAFLSVDGVEFNCTKPLNAGYIGQNPQPTSISAAGILFHTAYQTDFVQNNVCTFKNLLNGIVSIGGYIGVQNCKFDNMVRFGASALNNSFPILPNIPNITGGNGIYSTDGLLVQKGFGKNGQASFNDCQNYAIFCSNTSAYINDNKITNLHYEGIRVENINTFWKYSRIFNNSLSGTKSTCSAMIVLNNVGSISANHTIKDNDITINSNNNQLEQGFGIVIAGSLMNNINVLAEHNTINCDAARSAIEFTIDLENSTNNIFEIFNNPIMTTVSTLYGIYNNTKNNSSNIISISSNNLLGSLAFAGKGIWIDNSKNVDICSNIIDRYHFNIHYGSSNNCRLYRNDIKSAESGTGLWFNPNSLSSTNSHLGNTWLSTAASYGSLATYNAAAKFTGNSAINHRFDVNTNPATGGNPFFLPPSINVPNWFLVQNGNVTIECQRQLNGFIGAEWEELLAKGILNSSNTSKYDLFIGNQYLYAALRLNPTYLNSNSYLQTYYNNTINTDIGKLQNVNEALLNALTSVTINASTISNNLDAIIATMFTHLGNNANDIAIINDILNRINTNESLLNNRRNSVNSNLSAVIPTINNITSSDQYVQNAKSTNLALIDYVQNNGVLTTNNATSVLNIANQNIEDGGSYVILAKLLLSDCERKKAFQLLTIENRSSNREVSNVEGINLFPNPASDEITIQFNQNSSNSSYQYYILNNVGSLVRSGELNDRNTISIQNLQSGMYWVQIKDNSTSQICNKKFVKIN